MFDQVFEIEISKNFKKPSNGASNVVKLKCDIQMVHESSATLQYVSFFLNVTLDCNLSNLIPWVYNINPEVW